MAILSNINDKFAVDSTGAIQFNGQAGTSGYVLKSNGNAAPTWVDASTVIGGPYLPLSGGTLTGATATASGISFTVGGNLTAGDATAANQGLTIESGNGTGDYGVVRFKHGGTNRNTIHAFSQYWQSGTIYTAATDSLNFDGHAGVTIGPWNNIDVAFVQGGASYFKNNVGIGETNPLSKLHIKVSDTGVTSPSAQGNLLVLEDSENGLSILSSTAGAGYINFGDSDDNNVGMIIYGHSSNSMDFWTNAGKRMTIDSSGNVGIGTTSPSSRLQVKDSQDSSFDSGIGIIRSASSQTGYINMVGGAFNFNAPSGVPIRFRDGGTANVTIDGSGNVGIGTTSITNYGLNYTNLDVSGSNGAYLTLIGTTNTVKVDIAAETNAGYVGTKTAHPFIFRTDDAERMRIDSSGIVTVSNSGGAVLKLQAGTNSSASLRLINDAHDWDVNCQTNDRFAIYSHTDATERLVILPTSGNVGIGVTSPTYKLHVANSNNVSIFEDTSGASGASFLVFNVPGAFAIGSIGRNGTANSVLFNTGSDYRLKEDLQDFNALDLVNNITAYDYKWKNTEQRDYGFIAHELQEVIPNVVTGEKDGEKMQSVDYSKLTPILLKAIQELEARVKELENK